MLNICLLYTKYYIYIQHLFHGNELDLHTCLTQFKFALDIEYTFCKRINIDFSLINISLFMIAYKNIVDIIIDYVAIWGMMFS